MESQLTIDERQRFWKALDNMEESAKKVDKLYVAIVGDKELQQEGILERLEHLETKVESMDSLINKAKGWLAGATAVGVVVGWLLNSLLKIAIK